MTTFLAINKIEVEREQRQRRKIDISGLLDSIEKRGIISPLIVEKLSGLDRYKLLAGERRLTCAIHLRHTEVPVRLLGELSPVEQQIIELEENIKRSDLDWRDQCAATVRIHELYGGTQEQTANSLGFEPGWLSIILRVGAELRTGTNPLIQEAGGIRQAYNIVARHDSRKIDDVFNELMGGSHEVLAPSTAGSNPGVDSSAGQIDPSSGQVTSTGTSVSSSSRVVLNVDFAAWVQTYAGPPFSFVHCDFPYGIGLDKSDQGNTATWGSYSDTADTYWQLCRAFLENLDRILAPSSHLMFWLSARHDIQTQTRNLFSSYGLQFNPIPLIWFKSDGKGILPDPKRGPRHVYETALFCSRGDRLINQAVGDAYSAAKGEATHQSEKPEQMLRHFFRMFISDGSSFLDPTCGSGSSLCAAHSLGAKYITGLELNSEWSRAANARYIKSKLLSVDGLFEDA